MSSEYGNDRDLPVVRSYDVERVVFMCIFGALLINFGLQIYNQYAIDKSSFRKIKSVHTIFRIGGALSSICFFVAYVDLYGIYYIYDAAFPRVATNLGGVLMLGCYLACVYFALKAVYLMGDPGGKKIYRVKVELIGLFTFMVLTWAGCGIALHLSDRIWPNGIFWIIFLVEAILTSIQLTYGYHNISKELKVAQGSFASLPTLPMPNKDDDVSSFLDTSTDDLGSDTVEKDAAPAAAPSTPLHQTPQATPRNSTKNLQRAPVSSHGAPITSVVSGHVKRGSLFAPPKKSTSHKSLAYSPNEQFGFTAGPQHRQTSSISRSDDLTKAAQTWPPAPAPAPGGNPKSASNGDAPHNQNPSSISIDIPSQAHDSPPIVTTPEFPQPASRQRLESRSQSVQLASAPLRPQYRRRTSASVESYDAALAHAPKFAPSQGGGGGGGSSAASGSAPPAAKDSSTQRRRRSTHFFKRKSFIRGHNRRLDKWRQFTIYSDIGVVLFTVLCAGFNVTYQFNHMDEPLYNSRRDNWANSYVVGQYIVVSMCMFLIAWFSYAPLPYVDNFCRKCMMCCFGSYVRRRESMQDVPSGARNNMRGSILSVRSSKTSSRDRGNSSDPSARSNGEADTDSSDAVVKKIEPFDEEEEEQKSEEQVELVPMPGMQQTV